MPPATSSRTNPNKNKTSTTGSQLAKPTVENVLNGFVLLPGSRRESKSQKDDDVAFCPPAAPAATEVSEQEKKNARWDLVIKPHVNCDDECCNPSDVVDYVKLNETLKNKSMKEQAAQRQQSGQIKLDFDQKNDAESIGRSFRSYKRSATPPTPEVTAPRRFTMSSATSDDRVPTATQVYDDW